MNYVINMAAKCFMTVLWPATRLLPSFPMFLLCCKKRATHLCNNYDRDINLVTFCSTLMSISFYGARKNPNNQSRSDLLLEHKSFLKWYPSMFFFSQFKNMPLKYILFKPWVWTGPVSLKGRLPLKKDWSFL